MPRHALGVVSAFVLFGAAVLSPVLAQDSHHSEGWHGQGHSENHDWYEKLKQPGTGFSCCNGTINGVEGDCRPTRAFVDGEGHWRAWNGSAWLMVPQERVLPADYAGDGRSHLCEKQGFVYCFTPGEIRG